jgi:hypothetical protein
MQSRRFSFEKMDFGECINRALFTVHGGGIGGCRRVPDF